jgi:O-methyltransferase involved in polyketide biosynthesis
MPGEKVHLTREKETLLITLCGKALESRLPDSLLKDWFAAEAVGKIDYDFRRLKVDRTLGVGLAIRAKSIDDRVRAFIARHPDAVVLHLGCGLDSRVFRVNPPAGVAWHDVDYPEVIALRRRLYPDRENCRLVASSVTDPGLLETVPADRPAMIAAEGLTPYLPADEGPKLFARLVRHFDRGEIVCDAYSSLGLKIVAMTPSVRATGAELRWAINDPRDLEKAAPGLKLVEEIAPYETEHVRRMTLGARLFIGIWNLIPPLKKIGRLLRFEF